LPDRLAVLPLSGPVIDVEVDEAAGTALAVEARARLAEYNEWVPQPQPASPSKGVCATCEFAVDCAAFWAAYDETWSSEIVAARGFVSSVMVSNGRVTMSLNAGGQELVVRAIDEASHPEAADIVVSDNVDVVGLVAEPERGSARMGRWGQIRRRPAFVESEQLR
jgi:hypothetical protein